MRKKAAASVMLFGRILLAIHWASVIALWASFVAASRQAEEAFGDLTETMQEELKSWDLEGRGAELNVKEQA